MPSLFQLVNMVPFERQLLLGQTQRTQVESQQHKISCGGLLFAFFEALNRQWAFYLIHSSCYQFLQRHHRFFKENNLSKSSIKFLALSYIRLLLILTIDICVQRSETERCSGKSISLLTQQPERRKVMSKDWPALTKLIPVMKQN